MDSARRLILKVDGGGVYDLDVDRDALALLGRRVTVEGVRSGFNRLDPDLIVPI